MRPEINIIIINDLFTSNRKAKRYRATPEQIEQNRKEIAIQRERDQRAREEAYRSANSATASK